jgi:hypothetical protein
MPMEVDLYDGHYGHIAAEPQLAVRRETYDEDLGQVSWITLAEAREWFRLLGLRAGQTALEVACGSGGERRLSRYMYLASKPPRLQGLVLRSLSERASWTMIW